MLEAKGLFYGIVHSPKSQLLDGQVELDKSGYVLIEEGTAKTSVEGLFAAGDVQVILSSISFFISSVFNWSWTCQDLLCRPRYLTQDSGPNVATVQLVVILLVQKLYWLYM